MKEKNKPCILQDPVQWFFYMLQKHDMVISIIVTIISSIITTLLITK